MKDGISDVEAVRLIEIPPVSGTDHTVWNQGGSQTHSVKFDENIEDPFTLKLVDFEVVLYVLKINFATSFYFSRERIPNMYRLYWIVTCCWNWIV